MAGESTEGVVKTKGADSKRPSTELFSDNQKSHEAGRGDRNLKGERSQKGARGRKPKGRRDVLPRPHRR